MHILSFTSVVVIGSISFTSWFHLSDPCERTCAMLFVHQTCWSFLLHPLEFYSCCSWSCGASVGFPWGACIFVLVYPWDEQGQAGERQHQFFLASQIPWFLLKPKLWVMLVLVLNTSRQNCFCFLNWTLPGRTGAQSASSSFFISLENQLIIGVLVASCVSQAPEMKIKQT